MNNTVLFFLRFANGSGFIVQGTSLENATQSLWAARSLAARYVSPSQPENKADWQANDDADVIGYYELRNFRCSVVLTDHGELRTVLDGSECVAEVMSAYPFLEAACDYEALRQDQRLRCEPVSERMNDAVAMERLIVKAES